MKTDEQTALSVEVSAGRSPLGAVALGLLALLVYVVVVGGTVSGELHPALRLVNACVAGTLIIVYRLKVRARADRIDRWVLLACLLFALSGVLSQFPRQSLDAVLAALTYAAAFYLARGALHDTDVRTLFTRVLIALSTVFTIGAVATWLPLYVRWWSIAGWDVVPPLDLQLSSSPWGHRYDIAFLLVLLYPAWWIGRTSTPRKIAAVVVGLLGAIVVLITGSRTVWLAIILAAAAVLAPDALGIVRRNRAASLAAVGVLALTAGLAIAGTYSPLMERALNVTSAGWRLAMWAPLIDLWLAHPLAGVGPGAFPWALQLTPYFEVNSYAPRHPDSPIIQVFPEAGLLGIASCLLVLAAVLPAMFRQRSRATRFVAIAFLVAGLGLNPTDFAFVLVILLGWAAYAAPRDSNHREAGKPTPAGRPVAVAAASAALLAVIFATQASMLVAAMAYDGARVAAERGEVARARSELDLAVTLDPGMALYWRQRGIASYLVGDHTRAIADLTTATSLNPADDLAWRTRAIVHASTGQLGEAAAEVESALALQRSDVANLLVAAWLAELQDNDSDVTATMAEIVQAWPTITGAPRWSDLATSGSTLDLIRAAGARWSDDAPSPQPPSTQELWIASVSGDTTALDHRGMSPTLAAAYGAALRCEEGADALLGEASASDMRSVEYWATRIRISANRGDTDDDAITAFQIMMGLPDAAFRTDITIHPMNEGGWWGYRRLPFVWPAAEPALPDPLAGSMRWMRAPAQAIAEANIESQLADCRW